MKRRFLCSWKDEGQNEAEPFLSNSHEEAYKSFLSQNVPRSEPVYVWDEDEEDPVEYCEHIKSDKELASIQKDNENKPKSLLEHREDLRNKTAYPVLRGVLLLSAICGFVIWLLVGFLIADQYGILSIAGPMSVVAFGLIGLIFAISHYSVFSLFLDVADSTINTSRNSESKD